MTRASLSELMKGQSSLPKVSGYVDAILRGPDGEILQHVHQPNLVTEYHRLMFVPNGNWDHSPMYVFINETDEPMHIKRNAMRTTLPGTWANSVTPTLDGPNRIWTYQTVFAVPPTQRTIRLVGLARWINTSGYTNLKFGLCGINAATLLSTPIVQTNAATLEVSYRLALQRV